MTKFERFTPPGPLNTAVLFLVFNRPEVTEQVFKAIREAKPAKLYIAADGPRASRAEDAERCKAVRRISTNVDWHCEVKTLFRENNLGCKNAVSSAITWFFDQEEQGIILEDDCLPSQSFFWFSEEMLEMYKSNNQVGIISGSNYFYNFKDGNDDYYFSAFPFIWGWATWKRVWDDYDIEMKNYSEFKKNKVLEKTLYTKEAINYWRKAFDNTSKEKIDTWDYQLSFMIFRKSLVNVVPTVNLISNIGFGSDATHTTLENGINSNMKRGELQLPLNHPSEILRNKELDMKFEVQSFKKVTLLSRLITKMRRVLHV
jgi:hypothetical protein